MSTESLLQQMQDIVPPEAPPWWLLGPGYWLSALLAVLLAAIGWWLIWRHRANRLAQLAGLELDAIRFDYGRHADSTRLALELSRWIRRVALLAYPEKQLQSLHGANWLAFLDQSLGEQQFSDGCGRVFGDAIYQRDIRFDESRVLQLCEHWLKAVSHQLRQQGRPL